MRGIVVALTAALGCRDSTDVGQGASLALVTTVDPDPFIVVDLDAGRVVSRPPSGLAFQEDARAFSRDSALLLYSGAGSLVGFDLKTRAITWQEQLGADQTQRFEGQTIYANFALAFSPDGVNILLADSYLGGTAGIAVLDADSRAAAGWIGPLRAFELFTIPPNILAPDGGVLALGNRSLVASSFETERRKGRLYFLAGSPLEVRDSLNFLSPEDAAAGGVVDALLSADSRFLYFVTYRKVLHKYDLVARNHVRSLAVPVYGPLALSRDGGVLIVEGNSSRDDPGTGTIVIVDAELRAAQPISLAGASYDGVLPVLNGAAVSWDGNVAYVGAGTATAGPLFGSQRGRVLVIDLQTNKLVRVIETDTWGVRSILPLR